jgi:hypothetical protein
MKLRPGTLVDLLDRTAIPSEASLGELCLIVNECGYGVTEVSDTWKETVVSFTSPKPMVNGSVRVDRDRGAFDVVIIDHNGKLHRLMTTSDEKAFEYLSKYAGPVITEEVDIREKYKQLEHPARHLLSWMLQQYAASAVYVFAPNDIGEDMDLGDKDQAVDQLIEQGFLRMSGKDALVLDRTLADDMKDKSDLLGGETEENDTSEGLGII